MGSIMGSSGERSSGVGVGLACNVDVGLVGGVDVGPAWVGVDGPNGEVEVGLGVAELVNCAGVAAGFKGASPRPKFNASLFAS